MIPVEVELEVVEEVPSKRCTICRDRFDLDYFPRDRQNADGRRNECTFCRTEYRKRGITAAELRAEHEADRRSESEAASLKHASDRASAERSR